MEQNQPPMGQPAQPLMLETGTPKFTKNDAIASAVLGVIIGVFATVILRNIGKALPLQEFYFLIFPVLALLGMWIVYIIGARIPVLIQFVKFGAIGVANTAIDFGVLNFLTALFGVFSGPFLIVLNTISFSIAVINSFFWNKYWTFKASSNGGSKQFLEFIVVSVIGVLINSGIVYLIATFVAPFAGVSEQVWLNIGKILATVISLIWNFIGYKFIVFKK